MISRLFNDRIGLLMVSDASEDIESARTRQEGVGTIFAFLFPNRQPSRSSSAYASSYRRLHAWLCLMMLGAGLTAEPHEKAPHWELVGSLALLRAKARETIVQMV
jgi:hypothetical protein